jgi:maltooligosyltrehalose synthase
VLPLANWGRGQLGAGWVDVLTGAVFRGERVLLGELTRALPVALLVPEGE